MLADFKMTIKYSLYMLSFFFLIGQARRWYGQGIPDALLPGRTKPLKNEEAKIKNKLFSMVGQSKNTIDKKMEGIDTVHELFKNNTLYKIGYIVSYLNKTHDGLKEVFRFMDKKRNAWNVLRILSTYEQMIKANEFLSEMLKILNHMVMRQKTLNHAKNDSKMDTHEPRFGWSYYDEETSAK
ncbi:hypothetical protein O3G_MSEX012964 [Manduca sexta]|uniref:Uncharacterized protein n=1 Tax=Manduca sexta TaxID=7130 RepID=A0A922CXE3_MANSE|nr:hypothetical protein O3G_MSEX012964 [Manduca sexta]